LGIQKLMQVLYIYRTCISFWTSNHGTDDSSQNLYGVINVFNTRSRLRRL
jgi:hypothetical protein